MRGHLTRAELEKGGWEFLTNYDYDVDMCGDCCGGGSLDIDKFEKSPNHYVSDHATDIKGNRLNNYLAIYVRKKK